MDKADVQNILLQHGLKLSESELDSVLFRLSQRAQEETVYGGPSTLKTNPRIASNIGATAKRQRPATSTQKVYRMPLDSYSTSLPQTAPGRPRKFPFSPISSYSSDYSSLSLSDHSSAATSVRAAGKPAINNEATTSSVTPTITSTNHPINTTPQQEEENSIKYAPDLTFNTMATTSSNTIPDLNNNIQQLQLQQLQQQQQNHQQQQQQQQQQQNYQQQQQNHHQQQQQQQQQNQRQNQQQQQYQQQYQHQHRSKIAQIAVNDREESYILQNNGDPGTRVRAPWQSQKKQYRRQPNAIVVGGLDAVFRMRNKTVVDIDRIRENDGNELADKLLPPDIVVDPTTNRMVALPHQRKKMYDNENQNITIPLATRESQPVESPRIIELDARIADPLSGRKPFRKEDIARHASGGWAISLDYRDVHTSPWSTTAKHPQESYRSPMAHRREGKRELHPSWDGPTNGRVIIPIGPPERPKASFNHSAVNSPRLAYQRRAREMEHALKNWNIQKSVSRTYAGEKKTDQKKNSET
jgi:hypothetical protein